MSLSAAERRVLLAAAASWLRRPSREALWWCRTDTPTPQGLSHPEQLAVRRLIDRGLLEHPSRSLRARITAGGLDEAETLRSVLGRRNREILAAIDAAGELVRREREATAVEQLAIIAGGGVPTEMLVEWCRPVRRSSVARDPCNPRVVDNGICSGFELQGFVDRGLVVLLNGGTRALLTGAGRWCGQEVDHG